MFPIDLDLVAVNVNTVVKYDLESIEECDDGIVCCVEVRSKEQLAELMAEDYITIRSVFMDNEHKDSFKEFNSYTSSPTAFAMDDEDNDLNKVLEILLKS